MKDDRDEKEQDGLRREYGELFGSIDINDITLTREEVEGALRELND